MHAGRIDKNDLSFRAGYNSLNAIAGGLRFGSDDGDFLADQAIDQRGFSGVRASNNGNESRTKRLFLPDTLFFSHQGFTIGNSRRLGCALS